MPAPPGIARNLGIVGSILIGVSGVLQMIDGSFIAGLAVLGLALVAAGLSLAKL